MFKSGYQLIGYLEGRPGVVRVLGVEPYKPDGWKPDGKRPHLSRGDRERIRESPPALDAVPEEKRQRLREFVEAWEEAEDGGAWVEFEVESDSPEAA